MNAFFSFRSMITPTIIKAVYALFCCFCLIAGLIMFIAGAISLTAEQLLGGVLLIVFGPLVGRIYCEIVIVIFMINEHLNAIRARLERSGPQ